MPAAISAQLAGHLLRADGQEDVCLATYSVSTGATRTTSIVTSMIPPREGERVVHGNASFSGEYVVRGAVEAASRGEGLVILHSHPCGRGSQDLSRTDRETESDYVRVAKAITGQPLVGMTLAGADAAWSARIWESTAKLFPTEGVRVVGHRLTVTWNEQRHARPRVTDAQVRTVSAWGDDVQADIARLRVLVVGVGSVGLDVAQRLAATGIEHIGVMDFDWAKELNRDRMIGVTRADVRLARSKVQIARRLMANAATAEKPDLAAHETSVCDPKGLAQALDYDVIFSCVDRPWPRAVLNSLAYSDLIPVIDGGIAIDTFDDGRMRSASWRVQAQVPGHPCMACNGQLRLGDVTLDQWGLLDDPEYISRAGLAAPARQNVAALAASVSAGQLAQFVSLVSAPGGAGVPPRAAVLPSTSLATVTVRRNDATALPLRAAHWRRRLADSVCAAVFALARGCRGP
jgi:molybdopterin-synthase adenylyltransferase